MRAVRLAGTFGLLVVAGCGSRATPGSSEAANSEARPSARQVSLPPGYEDSVFLDAIVDVRPELLRMPPVQYPDTLRWAGVQGRVVLEFIVDTLGRVEPASLHVVQSPHPMFHAPALRAAREAEFRPAEVAGRRVRALVQLPIDFTLRAPK